jgi:hypothetical protein
VSEPEAGDLLRCLRGGPGHGTYWRGIQHVLAHPGLEQMVLRIDQVTDDNWISFTVLDNGEEAQVRGWTHSANLLQGRRRRRHALRWLPDRQFLAWENRGGITCISLCLDAPEPCQFPGVPRSPYVTRPVSPTGRRQLGHGPGGPLATRTEQQARF